MEALKTVWNFIQDEVLGMNWLDRLLATILNAVGLDTTGKIGSNIHFFIYDTIKIMVLLGVLILIMICSLVAQVFSLIRVCISSV